jgi:hypothetical protein
MGGRKAYCLNSATQTIWLIEYYRAVRWLNGWILPTILHKLLLEIRTESHFLFIQGAQEGGNHYQLLFGEGACEQSLHTHFSPQPTL